MEPVTDALLDRMVRAIVDEVDPDAVPIDRGGAIALVEALLERVGRRLAEADGT